MAVSMTNEMRFASATATERRVDEAIETLVAQIDAQVGDLSLDFGLLFFSPHFILSAAKLADQLVRRLNLSVLTGCSGEGVIGRVVEIEKEPAITLLVAHMPQVSLTPFILEPLRWDDSLRTESLFRQAIPAPDECKLFLMLADPFTTPTEKVLQAFNTYYPGIPIIGGLASGTQNRGGNILVANKRLFTRGAVGVAFAGAVEVDIIVSQGCRPIGEPLIVTEAKQNVIYSLEDEAPLTRIQRMLQNISPADQALLQENGLFVGVAVNEEQEMMGRGDFLVRGLVGVDEQSGAIAIGDTLQDGETIQLHVRDASTAEEDLEMMLSPQSFFGLPKGALLFSCNGRGTRLYNHPNGDISIIQAILAGVDLAGFFCVGEIGPIGGYNFLHSHTASMAFFRPGLTLDRR